MIRLSPLLVAIAAAAAVQSVRGDARPPRPKPSAVVPFLSIDLTRETVTSDTANVRISPIDWGNEISLTIANASTTRRFGITIPLASDETLTVLSAGGAAMTQTFPIPPGDYPGLNPPADYQSFDDQGPCDEPCDTSDQEPADTPVETTPDDGTLDIEDNQDPSWYPGGDQVDSGTRDGSDIASDALEQLGSQIPDGNYVVTAAFDPPLATDANGRAVPVFLAKSSNGLILSVSPSGATAFPIKVTLRYGYDPDSYDSKG